MPNIEAEMLRRVKLLKQCNESLEFRSLVLEKCRRDVLWWIDNFVFTSDPRNLGIGPVVFPFVLWSKQRDYIRWRRDLVTNREWGIIAKSRDSGISWLNTVDQMHYWLFERNYQGGFASQKAPSVDALGSIDSLLEKCRFICRFAPGWMRPGSSALNYMRLVNNDRNNIIVGKVGDNLGRGDRALVFDLDEAGFVEQADSKIAALSNTTQTLIRTSTPNGSGNNFARDYQAGIIPRFTFHWKEDPRKNRWVVSDTGETGQGRDAPLGATYPWYEKEKTRYDPVKIAAELDIDFSSSVEGVVIPAEWVQAAIDFPIILHNFDLQAGLDVATEGKDRTVLIEVDGRCKVSLIETWAGQNTTETSFRAIQLCHDRKVQLLNFDVIGVGAGVAGVMQTTPNLRFKFRGISGSESPSDYYWQGEERYSKDKFYNRRAELWWQMRQRFFKTWEMRNGINQHPETELISIPNHDMLVTQLSQPLHTFASNGKLLIESKIDMKKRGVKSPDFADALCYALARDEKPKFVQTSVSW
jgi:phage terminase large subunit